MKRIALILAVLLMASSVMAETLILQVNKSTVGSGEDQKQAYVVDGKELTAAAKAGTYDKTDIILTIIDTADVEKVKSDPAYLAESYLDLTIKYPEIAKEVLEMEYTVGEEKKRAKVSQWEKDGSPAGIVRLPVQFSGVESEIEYDSKGALK